MTNITRSVIGAALLAAVALGSSCGERTSQQSSTGQGLAVLWREPPAFPQTSTTTPYAAEAPSAAADIIWTVRF